MNRISSILSLLLLMVLSLNGQTVRRLTLDEAISIASDSSLMAFRHKNMFQRSYWEYRVFKAERLPSVSLGLSPQYYRAVTQRYDSYQDADVYREQQMFSISSSLGAAQNIDVLGGTLYLNTDLNYIRNFGDNKYTQYSSVPLQIGYRQEQIGYNAFKWDRKIEPLKYEKARKEFVYNMESLSEEVAVYFFNLAMAQADYELAVENCHNTDTLYTLGERRFEIAAISQSDLMTLKLDKINAKNSLQVSSISLKKAMTALADFLSLPKDCRIEIQLPSHYGELHINIEDAMRETRQNSYELLEKRQEVVEAEQNYDKAKKETLLNASFNASIGFNQYAEKLSDVYKNPLQQDLMSISLSIPLLDWGVKKGKRSMAWNNLEEARFIQRQKEISLEEEVAITVGDFNVQQEMIVSAEEAEQLAEAAYGQTMQRFIIGKADVNALTLSRNRQQEARKNYISALSNYWQNYYKIRKMTLFDFVKECELTELFDFNKGKYQ